MAEIRRKKRATKKEVITLPSYQARRWTLLGILAIAASLLIWRAIDQQIFETDFLQSEGQRRHLRTIEMPAHRGMIVDRRGEPLAISTPVDSIWANPRRLHPDRKSLAPLAKMLGKNLDDLRQLLAQRSGRSFVYLKRRINPELAGQVMAWVSENDITGIGLQREYRRFYPAGEVFAHVLGFTDIDDQGLEGLELAYHDWLDGSPGKKRVIRDGRARAVKDVERIVDPEPGQKLQLSLDQRLQYLAYRELKSAVKHNKAKSGSVVILDVKSGEILAMVNQPGYNPNGNKKGRRGRFRNRAVTDVYEPGSTLKPFTISAALEFGKYRPGSKVNTSPGYYRVGRNQIKDIRNYGEIDLATILLKSSNVGASKIALDLPKEQYWHFFTRMGFGESTNTGFPGESSGHLTPFQRWAQIDQATLAYGYGLSVTPLQLARAYGAIANNGVIKQPTLIKTAEKNPGVRVMRPEVARSVRKMMEGVTTSMGTAPAAAVTGYRVAGKTGTVRKVVSGEYSQDRYLSLFAGMIPASDPRLVMVILINEASTGKYYGGQVAGPVFSKVMSGAMRMLNIAPDNIKGAAVRLADIGGAG